MKIVASCFDLFIKLADRGHIYLQRYKVIAVLIIAFVMWQCHILTEFYIKNFSAMVEWQNLAMVGLVMNFVAILKFCLEHILKTPEGTTDA